VCVNRVTKEFRLGGTVHLGLKNLLLRSPKAQHDQHRRVRVEAIRDVSFEIARGEWLAMIGPNGSGKSTMLGLIAGVLHPTCGTIETHGRISPLLELGAGFHPELTGAENILLNGVILGLTRAMVRERFSKIVEFSGLGDEIDRPVRTYSSGMSARLGFAVAAHVDPEILIVDEVLAVGDEAFAQRCLDKLRSFHAAGVTIVVVSHQLTLVEELCDRALLLVGGKLVVEGAPAEVIATYRAGIAASLRGEQPV
jgi:ABC-type polysaccharide/polyol phosphate transport system ATPase subunit